MTMLQLPHTAGCLVCGRNNPIGLKITSYVDESTGQVRFDFVARPEHIGFQGVIHGGILATVLDEAMVWAATWSQKRFCLAGELTVRFRAIAEVGRTLTVTADTTMVRPRLVTTVGRIHDGDRLIAEGAAKYVPLPLAEHQRMVATILPDPATARAAAMLSVGPAR